LICAPESKPHSLRYAGSLIIKRNKKFAPEVLRKIVKPFVKDLKNAG